MCFSATASFIGGTVLAIAGVESLIKTKSRSQLLFASVPLAFATQQFSEGFLWLAFNHQIDMQWQYPLTYFFLFFAQVLWPSWAPISIMLLEQDAKTKKILKLISLVGVALSVYVAYCLLSVNVQSSVSGHHVLYKVDFPQAAILYIQISYVIATILPAFVSSGKGMKLLGLVILVSLIITRIFFTGYLISVWCFFAAIICTMIYFMVRDMRKTNVGALSNSIQ